MKRVLLTSLALFIGLSVAAEEKQALPKNVIIMIGDGMGFNHIEAESLFRFGRLKGQDFWKFIPLAACTYSLNTADGYNPDLAYKDFDYFKKNPTDSAGAATAISTGVKTKNIYLGIGSDGQRLRHLMEDAESMGKATGVLSTVFMSHATPAGFIVHEASRDNYVSIANQMLWESAADAIFAPGHPWYDDNGKQVGGLEPDPYKTTLTYNRVGGLESWKKLLRGEPGADADGDGTPDPWTLVQSRQDIRALTGDNPPKRVLGLVPVHSTLQQSRSGNKFLAPYQEAQLTTSPTMQELLAAALNVLHQDNDGFVLMAEGGAIDWASHANQSGRMVEEVVEFDRAVELAMEWVEKNSSWDETLLIVTADHECGYLVGPGSDPTWQPLIDHGVGALPGMEWRSTSHTNQLVPLFVKGAGANVLAQKIRATDPVRGPYVDNTDIPKSIREMWEKTKS